MCKATIVCQGVERAGNHTESCRSTLQLRTGYSPGSIGYGQAVGQTINLHGWQRKERGDFCGRHRAV